MTWQQPGVFETLKIFSRVNVKFLSSKTLSRSNDQFPALDFGTMQMVSVRRTQNKINYSFRKITALCIKILMALLLYLIEFKPILTLQQHHCTAL